MVGYWSARIGRTGGFKSRQKHRTNGVCPAQDAAIAALETPFVDVMGTLQTAYIHTAETIGQPHLASLWAEPGPPLALFNGIRATALKTEECEKTRFKSAKKRNDSVSRKRLIAE